MEETRAVYGVSSSREGSKEKLQIELKDGANGFKVVGTITRIPQFHSGWEHIIYKGKRYQLHGNIRNPWFINIDHPL